MREKILKVITTIAAILFILSLCCMDSESNVPFAVGMVSCGWLGLIAVANS